MNITSRSQVTPGNIPAWRQLKWNLVIFAVFLALVPVLVVGVVVLQQTRTQTLTQVTRQLESVTALKQNEIRRWLTTSNQIIDVFVSDRARFNVLSQFVTSTPEAQAVTFDGINGVLLNGIKAQGENAAFKELFLYDTAGRIVSSSEPAQIGKVVSRQPYFANSLTGAYTQSPYYDIGSNGLTMLVTRPLTNAVGDVVGVIGGRLDLTTLGNIMTERVGLGDTGETYLISIENNYLMTPSRFEGFDQNRAYRTVGINKALAGESGTELYTDYRNIPVVGVYRWVPELKAAFLAEIDESEALVLYNNTLSFGTIVLVLAALGATLIAFYNATRVSRPITALTTVASRIAGGDFSERANVSAQNEIGVLASTFNGMAAQLQDLIGSLEERVSARTRDLQIVANVSKSATTILNLDELLQSVVDLTKQSFQLYHAHVYLLDDEGENLVLTAGAGEPGRIMKEQGRQIALNNPNSLVARAGRSRKGVIENDVTKAPDFLANPLLPNTKSELAVPLVVGDRLIGVLDVQSDVAGRFTQEDIAVQSNLADQIAISVQNARAFAEVQSAEEKALASQEELLQAQRIARIGRWTWVPATGAVGWNDMMYEHFGESYDVQPTFDVFLKHVHPDDSQGLVQVMQNAMESGAQTFTHEYRVIRSNGEQRYHAAIGGITRDENGVATYLVGTAQDITERKQTDAERQLVFETANRLNNVRERRDVLQAILPYAKDRGAFTSSLLYIDTDVNNMPEWAEIVGDWAASGASATPVGTRFYLPDLPFAKLWMINSNEPLFVENVMADPRVDETTRGIMQQTGGHALAILPMTTQGRWIGLATFSWPEPRTFTESDQRIFTSIMQQSTATVDALRSAEETLKALAQTESLYLGNERIGQATTYDAVLNALVETTALYKMDRVSLGFYNRQWAAEQPESMIITSLWTNNGDTTSGPVGTVYPLDRFPITKYMKRDAPLVIRDVEKDKHVDENTRALLGRLGMHSMLAFPIVANNEWIGSLTVQNKEVRLLEDEEIRQISSLTDQAAIKIQSIRLLEETQKRAAELETVAQVSAAATTLLDVNALLEAVVDLTKESFGLYHAHIYLLDDAGERLVLTAGAGEPGRVMKEQGRAIMLTHPNSLVARAGRSRKGAIANDVTKDPDFLPNPLLPNTKSELAVPLVIGDSLIGVLDVQSDRINRFSDDDVTIQAALADQIAVAIENARAFTRIQKTEGEVREREQRYQQILDGVRDLILVKGEKSRIVWANKAFREYYGMTQDDLQGMIDAPFAEPDYTQQYIIDDAYVFDNGVSLEIPEEPVKRFDGEVRLFQTVKTPIFDQDGKVFLTVGVSRDITDRKESEAERQIGYEVASHLNSATKSSDVLSALLPYARQHGIVTASVLYIDVDKNNEPEWLTVVSEWTQSGQPSTPPGTRFYLPEFPIAGLWMSSPNEPLLIEDIDNAPIMDEMTRTVMHQIGTQAMAILPMVTQNRWIAVAVFSWTQTHPFSEQEHRVYRSMMQQATATVDALRSAEETQQARADAEILYRVSTLINEAQDEQNIVDAITQHTVPEGINSVSLNLNEGADYEKANYIEVVGSWRRDGTSNRGRRIPLAGFSNAGANDPHNMTIINDVKAELPEAAHPAYEALNVAAVITMPLAIGGRLVGSLSLSGPNPYYFSKREVQMWRSLAEQAATTLERIYLAHQTNRRAAEMETVAQVSAATTSILNIDDMLLAVTNLTKESFGLYHAHVYLLDDTGENLVLAGGAGEAGRVMKAMGRAIPVAHSNSLVARAASTREGAIANDVTQAPDFLPNPLLPNTKSELAVPMVVGDKLIGVLDVQSDITNRFSDDDVQIQGTLAAQIAVAVENARAFERVAEANEEVSRIFNLSVDMIGTAGFDGYFKSVNPAWERILGWTTHELTTTPFIQFVHPDDRQRTLDEYASEMAAGKSTISFVNRYMCKDGSFRWLSWNAIPFMQESLTYFVTRDVTTERAHEEEQRILYEVSRAMTNARTSDDVLESITAYTTTRGSNSASLFHIDTEDGTPTWIEVAANRSDGVVPTVPVGSRFYLPEFHMASVWMSDPTKPLLVNDVRAWEESDPAAYTVFKQLGTAAIAIVPLYNQERWQGLLTFSWHQPVEFTASDERILTSAMRQATTTIDALRASALNAKRAAELQTVAQVSAAATMVLDVEALLQSVVDLTKEAFGLYHAHVYLIDETGENLVLTAGAGEPGRIMKEQGRTISINHQNSIVARAARNRDGTIANDVTESPDFLPNPLLPDTRSEMAIPLVVGDEVIGVLDVQANTVNRFTADDLAIQSTLADQISVAVQNARAFKVSQETAERLREFDRLKSQFLANMSHELRTPLNSIIGYAEVLLDGIDGDLSDEAVEDVQAIHGGGKHLLTIINDILDLAKIEAGQMFMDRQEANLTQVVDEVMSTLNILAKNKNITLTSEADGEIPKVFGDPIRLKQIIFNLVNNSIKFTEKGGVSLNLGMMNDNSQVVVAVHDSGIGMTEEDMAGLFQQFHQVDGSATRRAGGTGLGLVITRHLIHMHEGEIYVESEKGVGSTFWFTLPVYTNQPRQRA